MCGAGGHRSAGQRRRRGVRRHQRRLAVRPPRAVGRRRRQRRSRRLLQQGDRPRGLPPPRDGAVHGRHCRLGQAPGPGDRRPHRLLTTIDRSHVSHHRLSIQAAKIIVDSVHIITPQYPPQHFRSVCTVVCACDLIFSLITVCRTLYKQWDWKASFGYIYPPGMQSPSLFHVYFVHTSPFCILASKCVPLCVATECKALSCIQSHPKRCVVWTCGSPFYLFFDDTFWNN